MQNIPILISMAFLAILIYIFYIKKPKHANTEFSGYEETHMDFAFEYDANNNFIGSFLFEDGNKCDISGSYLKENKENPIKISVSNDLIYNHYSHKQLEGLILTVIQSKEQEKLTQVGQKVTTNLLDLPCIIETMEVHKPNTESKKV